MNRRLLLSVIVVLVVVSTAVPLLVSASDGYDYEIVFLDNSVDVPDKTVTVEGETYTVNSIGFVDPGNTFDVTVETENPEEFDLYLYNNDKRIQDTRSLFAGNTVTFDSSNLEPGTYSAAVNVDSNFEAAKPIVVRAYDVNPPETEPSANDIDPGEAVTVTTTLSDLDPVPISHVELVVWDGSDSNRLSMSETEDGSYEGTIQELDKGSYELYVVVYGDDEIEDEGENELIALSYSSSVTVSNQDSNTDDGTQDDSGSGGQTTTSTTTTEDPNEITTTTTTIVGENTTSVNETDTGPSTTIPPTTPPTSTSETTNPTGSTTEPKDGVITPATTTGKTRGETPLYGIPLFIIALLLIGFGANRQ